MRKRKFVLGGENPVVRVRGALGWVGGATALAGRVATAL